MITRFAPSPTGLLHLGHVFSSALAHRLAREHEGKFLLRFEDIDHTRVRPKFYAQIEEDLRYLGFQWDETPWRQLERLAFYDDALAQLKDLNVVYPCYCTRREIQNIANAPQGSEGPLYPGTCRDKTPQEGQAAWRLNMEKARQLTGPLTFIDELHGTIQVDANLLGDVVLARKDIATSYHLAVVVDDAAQGITHVTRGEDLLPSTHVHRVLQALLQLPEPRYHHHRLILDSQGERLAKRHDSLSLKSLREEGLSPSEILARLE